jgi:hypothetical protein
MSTSSASWSEVTAIFSIVTHTSVSREESQGVTSSHGNSLQELLRLVDQPVSCQAGWEAMDTPDSTCREKGRGVCGKAELGLVV